MDVGLETQGAKRRFEIRDLGVLDGPPLRGASTIVNTVDTVLRVPRAVLLVFDDESSSISVRASSSTLRHRTFKAHGSIASKVRFENETQAIGDLEKQAPKSAERDAFNAAAVLSAPVYGPGKDPVGVLSAIHLKPHDWTIQEASKLEDFAHLVSQEILLRASFQTLKIMASERSWMSV